MASKHFPRIIICFWLVSLYACQAQHGPTSLEEADRLYFQFKAEESLAMYGEIRLTESYSMEDRAKAGIKTAKMQWLFYGNLEEAISILQSIQNSPVERANVFLLWSRVLRTEKDYDGAALMALKAKEVSTSAGDTHNSELAWMHSVLEKYRSTVLLDSQNQNFQRAEDLKKAHEYGNTLLYEKPGDVEGANLALGLNLLMGDWENAYKSWLSFFRFTGSETVHKTLAEAHNKLMSHSTAGKASILNFVLGLKESGFIEYANLLAKQHPEIRNLAPDQIGDIEAYNHFIEALKERTLELYQATVIGEESQSGYKRDFYDLGEQLWNNLNWETDVPGFSQSRFEAELRSRFNTLYEFQKSNGIFGLHMGHIVLDDKRRICQHGKEADLRYIAIEHMVSNGYSSWFWDGEAASGGWTKEDFFLQVRSSYNRGPLTAWLMVSDSAEVERRKMEIAEKSKLDDQLATEDPYAYLPGASLRISFDARMRLYDSLKAIYSGPDLRMAFINQYEQRTRKSSIFAHEGRHAIDDIFSGFIWASEDEFRAKLSEIYFADDPFDALRAIFAQNIGSGTSHGKANLKVMNGLVMWINEHQNEIRNFDINRPALPQLDLLTPAQLRLAVKSIDPLVN